jgi:hypothetical protein
LEALVMQKATVRLRRIDIDSWDSAVAREHEIRRLPSLVLCEGTRVVSRDTGRIMTLMSQP